MIPFLAQTAPKTFWNAPAGSPELLTKIAIAFIAGILLIFALMAAPAQLRRPVIVGVTFLSGLFYVLYWAFPSPIDRQPEERPTNPAESVAFWLADAQPIVAQLTNIIAAFLIGLGVYSLLRIHVRRFVKFQKDWFFSGVLLASLIGMVVFGYWDYSQRQGPNGANLGLGVGWGPAQYGKDLLFDGLLQQMDAGMFSVVGFYIISAAYRAFRARSAEATILLVTALIVMLSLLGALTLVWDQGVIAMANSGASGTTKLLFFLVFLAFAVPLGLHVARERRASLGLVAPTVLAGLLFLAILLYQPGNPNAAAVVENLKITEIAGWIRNNMQTPSIRGIEFGVGIGLLAMGLRIWLSLEKTGGNI